MVSILNIRYLKFWTTGCCWHQRGQFLSPRFIGSTGSSNVGLCTWARASSRRLEKMDKNCWYFSAYYLATRPIFLHSSTVCWWPPHTPWSCKFLREMGLNLLQNSISRGGKCLDSFAIWVILNMVLWCFLHSWPNLKTKHLKPETEQKDSLLAVAKWIWIGFLWPMVLDALWTIIWKILKHDPLLSYLSYYPIRWSCCWLPCETLQIAIWLWVKQRHLGWSLSYDWAVYFLG